MNAGSTGKGRFITFEGGEGAGKSTQIRLLAETLRTEGKDVVMTREPGGTPGAEAIRSLLVTGDPGRWDATTEALLNTAARRDHVERVIRPALQRGAWVLCDRFADSTMAYQGYAGGLEREGLEALCRFAVGDLESDLTIILDLPVEYGLKRAGKWAGDEIRFESRDRIFHEKVRSAFLDIAARTPRRCKVLDAMNAPEQTAIEILHCVRKRLDAYG